MWNIPVKNQEVNCAEFSNLIISAVKIGKQCLQTASASARLRQRTPYLQCTVISITHTLVLGLRRRNHRDTVKNSTGLCPWNCLLTSSPTRHSTIISYCLFLRLSHVGWEALFLDCQSTHVFVPRKFVSTVFDKVHGRIYQIYRFGASGDKDEMGRGSKVEGQFGHQTKYT